MSEDFNKLKGKIDNYNQQLGLKSINQAQRKQLGKQLIENLKLDWIFNRPIEKLIIAGSFLFTVYTIVRLILNAIK